MNTFASAQECGERRPAREEPRVLTSESHSSELFKEEREKKPRWWRSVPPESAALSVCTQKL
ncbi:UNVERIFIED_CONTAM: hypothetical protein FKN15_070913 [Acipenser sinensis]